MNGTVSFLRELNIWSMMLRIGLAMLIGGVVGMERERKRRAAGFRTHILICLGAAVTTLTAQYIYLVQNLYTDVARLGAQVVAGIGFIGAGTIIVTKRQHVKGLTTAAGLWTSAIIGLVCGAGFVECAIFATVMVLVAELLLVKIEYRFTGEKRDINLYIEYTTAECIEEVLRLMREKSIKVSGLEITKIADGEEGYHYYAVMTLSVSEKKFNAEIIDRLNAIERVINVEEL